MVIWLVNTKHTIAFIDNVVSIHSKKSNGISINEITINNFQTNYNLNKKKGKHILSIDVQKTKIT